MLGLSLTRTVRALRDSVTIARAARDAARTEVRVLERLECDFRERYDTAKAGILELQNLLAEERSRSDRRDQASAESIRELVTTIAERDIRRDPMSALAAQLEPAVANAEDDAPTPSELLPVPDLSTWLGVSGGEPPPGTVWPGRPHEEQADATPEDTPT